MSLRLPARAAPATAPAAFARTPSRRYPGPETPGFIRGPVPGCRALGPMA